MKKNIIAMIIMFASMPKNSYINISIQLLLKPLFLVQYDENMIVCKRNITFL